MKRDAANIFLKDQGKRASWKEVEETFKLANYVSHQLTQQGHYVVRKNLPFKQPKGKAPKAPKWAPSELSNTLREEPPLKVIKGRLEKYLNFEHEKLNEKVWVIVSVSELASHNAYEIRSIMAENSKYSVVLVSAFPLKSKIIDIRSILR